MSIIKKRYTICNSCGYVRPINVNKNLTVIMYDKCNSCGFVNKFSKEINDFIKTNQNDFIKKKHKNTYKK